METAGGRDAEPVIIDTDPGVDDAIALLMALESPSLDVIGLTTTAGNVPLGRATINALALLEHMGRTDIPVSRGAARPVRGKFAYSRHVHTAEGLTHRLPEPITPVASVGAVRFLADALRANPGEVSVIALGPLTNLARLQRRYPSALRMARRIIVMGGAVDVAGNVTPHSEFNFYSDPTAARQVMESGLPITLIDMAPCRQVYFGRGDEERLDAQGTAGKLALSLLEGWFRIDSGRQSFNLYDPLTVVAAVAPHAMRLRSVTMEVDDADRTDDTSLWGRSRVVNEGGPVQVVRQDGVDVEASLRSIREMLGWKQRT